MRTEYGGGSYLATASSIFFANFADQRLYRQDIDGQVGPITPEPASPSADRFADLRVTADEQLLVCVRERHPADGGEAGNELVVLPTDGSAPPRTIVSGHDFFSSPRISPNGQQLAWLTWDHPRMPWDGTELWIGDFQPDGSVSNPRRVAGGPRESIFQPEWSPTGVLHFVSDRTGWWNLYRPQHDTPEALAPMEAEFGAPQWVFGMSRYAFLNDGLSSRNIRAAGSTTWGTCDPASRSSGWNLPYSVLATTLSTDGQTLVTIAASPTAAPCAVRITPSTGAVVVLGRSVEEDVDPAYLARPRPIAFRQTRARRRRMRCTTHRPTLTSSAPVENSHRSSWKATAAHVDGQR